MQALSKPTGHYSEWAKRRLEEARRRVVDRPDRERGPSFFRKQALKEAARVAALLAADKVGAERKAGPSRRHRAKMVVPTQERLAKGDHAEWINPAEIDSEEQAIGLTRRFKSSHLDRLLRQGKISWVQWYAGDWYRNQHARCSFALSVVGGYGVGSGSCGEPSYGLPRTEAQARAREIWKAARAAMGPDLAAFMDPFLIHDDYARAPGGRQRSRNVVQIALALDRLARFLRLVPDEAPRRPARAGGDEAAVNDAAPVDEALRPEVDAAFLDEAGRMRPFSEIAEIIRMRRSAA